MASKSKSARLDFDAPVVLQGASLSDVLETLLETAASGSLIISCLEKGAFVEMLKAELDAKSTNLERMHDQGEAEDEDMNESMPTHREDGHHLLERTLDHISASNNVKIAFCTSIRAFHAYLSYISLSLLDMKHTKDQPGSANSRRRFLVVVNLVSLHRGTPWYSAQGLGRAFAAAVEVAFKIDARLLAIECPSIVPNGPPLDDEAQPASRHANAANLAEGMSVPARGVRHDPHVGTAATLSTSNAVESAGNDPAALVTEGVRDVARAQDNYRGSLGGSEVWDEQVPIVNSTIKSFGFGSSTEWTDKKVKIRDIASRWFRFEEASLSA